LPKKEPKKASLMIYCCKMNFPTRQLVSARHLAHSYRYVALKMFTEHFLTLSPNEKYHRTVSFI